LHSSPNITALRWTGCVEGMRKMRNSYSIILAGKLEAREQFRDLE
jgi:hypothetical protein